MSLRIKIRTNILLHFLFVLLTLAIALIGLQYYFSEKMARESINDSFHQTAHKIALTLEERDRLSKEILYQIEAHPSIGSVVNTELPLNTVKHFIHTLKRYDNMYAIYLGYANGDFFEVINMHIGQDLHTRYKAPSQTRWTIIKIYDAPANGRIREFIFLDKALNILAKKEEPSTYRVTVRPWYRQAVQIEEPVRSEPYLFSNLQEKGITYSKRLADDKTVLALDFTLKSMHTILQSLPYAQKGNIYLYEKDGTLIGSSVKTDGKLSRQIQAMVKKEESEKLRVIRENGSKYFAMLIPLSASKKRSYVGITVNYDTIAAPYKEKIYYALAIALVMLLMFIPLTLYLTDHIVSPIKALMRENEKIKARHFDQVKAVDTNIIELIELSDSQISLSKSIQEYQYQQAALLDAFIMLIADAIDAKSAYTGAHCKKVPIIATMLAKEANRNYSPAFEHFHFSNDDEWEAFERAAWLHDCGKITTPEYVVDKATKLETIYNRIHEVRTRFEVIWRDIEIGYYEALLKGEDEKELKKWKEEEQRKLLDDFTFIASCNLGSEFMEEEKVERIKAIAKRTWLRHFDNRLGLSEEELARYTMDQTSLPATESLLNDGKEHLIERIGFDEKAYHEQGFKLKVPTYLYNRGEIYNLCVQKGTLTDEERFKINEHVIMTIKMLEQLPLPEDMKEVPHIAGEHHETMDGTGYPRCLGKEQLSIPSRIMAIADIFEALTASDRPYKKAKMLSEALKIMYYMKKDQHIDADLFDLFVRSGIYLDYAKAYLEKEQIDDVDIESLLG